MIKSFPRNLKAFVFKRNDDDESLSYDFYFYIERYIKNELPNTNLKIKFKKNV